MYKIVVSLFIFLSFFFIATKSNSQTLTWQDISGPPPFFVLKKAADGKLLAAYDGGSAGSGKVLSSTDGGVNWVNTSVNTGAIFELVTNNQTAIVTRTVNGNSRYLVHLSTDNGVTWNQIYALTFGFSFFAYNAFTISDSGVVFCMGPTTQSGWGFARYGGTNRWYPIGSALFPYSDFPLFTKADHANNLYVGSSAHGLFISSNGGTVWKQTLAQRYVSSLITDLPQMLIAGTSATQITSGGVFLSSDGGTNWALLGLTGIQITSLAHDDANNIYASTDQGVYKYGGSPNDWQDISPLSGGLNNLLGIDSTTILGTSTTAGMYISKDRGGHWSQNAIIQQDISALLATSAGDVIVGTIGNRLFRSTNQGKAWSQAVPGSICDYINALGRSGEYFYAASDCGVYLSTDDGNQWNNVSTGSISGGAFSLATTMSGSIYAGTNFGVYVSPDSGKSWQQDGLVNNKIISLAASPANDVLALTSAGGLYLSPDNGLSWNVLSLTRDDIQTVNIDNAGNIFLGVSGGVMISGDRGQTWSFKGLSTGYVYSIAFTGAATVLAGAVDGMYLSTNSGQTWAQKNPGVSKPTILSMYADDGGNIFAGMYHGGLLKSTQPLTSVEILPALPQSSQLFQNYPNPFNPTTNFGFRIAKFGLVTVKVFDLLGREVATLLNEMKAPGEYYVGWDASSMPSGVYFYRLQTEKYSDTKKMLLLK